jgi:hypothetical protein
VKPKFHFVERSVNQKTHYLLRKEQQTMVTKVATKTQGELVYKRGNGSQAAPEAAAQAAKLTAEDIKVRIQAHVEAMLNNARAARLEAAEPQDWWDIFGFGPFQIGANTVPPQGLLDSPLLPHQVIRIGESAFIATVIVINPDPLVQDPLIVPTDILTGFKLPYQVQYSTLNTTTGQPVASMNVVNKGHLVPGQSVYVDVLEFVAYEYGCVLETNICARILDCYESEYSASPFAAFATWMFNPDDESFLAGLLGLPAQTPGFLFNTPIRFATYK